MASLTEEEQKKYEGEKWLSSKQMNELTGIDTNTLYNYRTASSDPLVFRTKGRRVEFPESMVKKAREKYFANNGRYPAGGEEEAGSVEEGAYTKPAPRKKEDMTYQAIAKAAKLEAENELLKEQVKDKDKQIMFFQEQSKDFSKTIETVTNKQLLLQNRLEVNETNASKRIEDFEKAEKEKDNILASKLQELTEGLSKRAEESEEKLSKQLKAAQRKTAILTGGAIAAMLALVAFGFLYLGGDNPIIAKNLTSSIQSIAPAAGDEAIEQPE